MFLFQQNLLNEETQDISRIQCYNFICEFLNISKKIIFTDYCGIFMSENNIFHTSYIPQVKNSSYIITFTLEDVKILKSIQHNHKIIFIVTQEDALVELSGYQDIIYVKADQDAPSIAYDIKEAIE